MLATGRQQQTFGPTARNINITSRDCQLPYSAALHNVARLSKMNKTLEYMYFITNV